MEKLWMCRICLVEDVQMHLISETHLQTIYEALTCKPFETEDNRPIFTCYICYAELKNSYQLKMRCLRSEKLFTQMLISKTLHPKDRPITKRLSIVHPVLQLSLTRTDEENIHFIGGDVPALCVDVKIEHENAEEIDDLTIEENRIKTVLTQKENELGTDQTVEANSLSIDVTPEQSPKRTDVNLIDNDIIIVEENVGTDSTLVKNDTKTDVTLEQRNQDSNIIETGLTLEENILRTDVDSKDDCIRTNVNLGQSNLRTDIKSPSPKKYVCQKVLRVVLERITLSNNKTGVLIQKESSPTTPKENTEKMKANKAKKLKQRKTNTHTKINTINKSKSLIQNNKNKQTYIPKKQIVKKVPFSDIDKENILKIVKLQTMKKIKKKPFICDICKKCFTLKDTLRIHIRAHTQEKPFKCDQCVKSFHQRCAFVMHYRTHTGDKPFRCGVCQKGFHRKDCLDRHTVIHFGLKPYKCQECGRGFNVLSNLTQHVRTHTGVKPYKCTVCGKSCEKSHHWVSAETF